MLLDASNYGPGGALACLGVINGLRERAEQPLKAAPDDDRQIDITLPVYANHGRWVVDCPCGSAQLASRDDPRFLCVECDNAFAGGAWVQIGWPDEVDEIERLLEARPDPRNQNWKPGESLDALEFENVMHGVSA